MNELNRVASFVLASVLLLGGCAATSTPSVNTQLQSDVQAAVSGDGRVLLSVVNGVATLTGVVNSAADRQAAERVLENSDGIDEIVNLISVDD